MLKTIHRKRLFSLALFCLGGGLLYGTAPMLMDFGIQVLNWPLLHGNVAGGIIGAAFLWGLAQYAHVLGRRPVLLVLLVLNPFSWVMPFLLVFGVAGLLSGPAAMNLGLAVGFGALFYFFVYSSWFALTGLLLKRPGAAALFGGLSGMALASISGIVGSWLYASFPLWLSELFNFSKTISNTMLILEGILAIAVPLLLFWLGWPRQSRFQEIKQPPEIREKPGRDDGTD